LCPSRHPPQSVAVCPAIVAGRILSRWAPNHARQSTARQCGRRQRERGKHAGKPTGSPSRRGTSACSAFRVRRSHRQRWAMRSTPGLAISKSAAFCNTHQTVALDIVRRPKTTPVHELERYMRCRQCSEVRGYAYKRSHLVALRATKITASDPPSTWWPGER
jgi:hypothetical protein